MATAVKTDAVEAVIKVVEVSPAVPATVTLTMSLEDAEALRLACDYISGYPAGPRGGIDRINDALHDAGVSLVKHPVGYNGTHNSLWLGSRTQ
jgi:hypothetical protein